MKTGRKPVKKAIVNKVITLKAMGKSEKQILSKVPQIKAGTVQKIVRVNRDRVEIEKAKYIKLINHATGGDKRQAKVLNECLGAETDVFNFKGECVGSRPDHKIRLDTVKYLDKIKGREQQAIRQTQNNTFIGKDLDRYM